MKETQSLRCKTLLNKFSVLF
uniref:Uncharacterized protein n=1 Tax=Lepeophtheirus salmonis TaxID=72036 RepID=A0A0K2V4Q0_LEPSM